MNTNRQYRIYSQKFLNPLKTAHGLWKQRDSIILREENELGRISFGEICPTPGFINEKISFFFPMIEDWQRGGAPSGNILFKSAISCLMNEIWELSPEGNHSPAVFSAELVAGNSALNSEPAVYKKKIGLSSPEFEIPKIFELLDSIDDQSSVRLDANESLSIEELYSWEKAFGKESRIEFIEQPLRRDEIDQLFQMDKELQISLALDESLVWKNDFSFFETNGWDGFYIVKPVLFEDWDKMLNFIRAQPDRVVVSTSFESPFGYEAVCRCASLSNQVAGLDRSLYEQNDFEFPNHHLNPLFPYSISHKSLDYLWNKL